jgi:hypothetical protein
LGLKGLVVVVDICCSYSSSSVYTVVYSAAI